jgi:branched-chain amino acid transport system ATP-binding protein
MNNAAQVLVQADDLHAHYGASHVLRGVSITIHAGESIGLLGRNGMGKSTLIRTLMGHVRASGGGISVRGKPASGMRADQIARLGIAYVPEGRGVFPNLSVRENLLMAARPGVSGKADWTFDRVMNTFPRLGERIGNSGNQLSGGEQQMLSIGRALMTNPDLLILDEATEGLAPLIVREIWRIVSTVRSTGIASLIVDRNFKSVLAHTDRCVVMEKGRLVLQDSSAALSAQPATLTRYLGV